MSNTHHIDDKISQIHSSIIKTIRDDITARASNPDHIRTFTMKDGVTLKDFYVQSTDLNSLEIIWAECSAEDPTVFIREEYQMKINAEGGLYSKLSLV